LRLRQICLVTPELGPAVDDLRAVFGIEVCYVDPEVGRFGLENSVLPVGSEFLEVVAPMQSGTAAGRYLERRGGAGGYMFITQCDDAAARDRHLEALGVRTAFRHRSETYDICQLHPRDTGGTFFEIDWQPGGDADPELWHPAGPDPAPARRTDVVTGILAAELQSPDPQALARRWSQIAGISLEDGEGGSPTLRLENASLRFVACADGRPEGLGGVDLAIADRARLLRAAEQRGCRLDDERVLVCGTRFRLAERDREVWATPR
jgi:hypothetical protein